MSRREVLRKSAALAAGGMVPAALSACTSGVRGGPRPAGIPDKSAGAPLALSLRRAEERGAANYGWLDTRYSFSFAGYYDPRFMGFRSLRVINEDRIDPAGGFPWHPHKDMEIVTYVLSGALEHKDSTGNGGVIRPGEVQQMSAGTGIHHSEFNPSRGEGVHLLQIWIEPDEYRVKPSYDQKVYPREDRIDRLRLVASGDGRDGSIRIHSATNLYASILEPNRAVAYGSPSGRHVWLQIAQGEAHVNGVRLKAGDGASASGAGTLEVRAGAKGAEILLFDLA